MNIANQDLIIKHSKVLILTTANLSISMKVYSIEESSIDSMIKGIPKVPLIQKINFKNSSFKIKSKIERIHLHLL